MFSGELCTSSSSIFDFICILCTTVSPWFRWVYLAIQHLFILFSSSLLTDLHHAWKNLSSKFFLILSLLLLSTLSFLIASLIDPGFESFSKEAPLLYKLNEELIKSSIDEVNYNILVSSQLGFVSLIRFHMKMITVLVIQIVIKRL